MRLKAPAVGSAVVAVVAVSLLLWKQADAKPPGQPGPPTAIIGTLVMPGQAPIALQGVSWSGTRPVSGGGGGGAGGVASFEPISVTKNLDAASPVLLQLLTNGHVFMSAQITLTGGETLLLEGVQVIGQSVNGGSETVLFHSERRTLQVGEASFCWDSQANTACGP